MIGGSAMAGLDMSRWRLLLWMGVSFGEIIRNTPILVQLTLAPLASNFVQLITFSSLGAVISVSEITRRGMELSSSTFRSLEIFTFIAVVCFCTCWPAMAIRIGERRLANQ